MNFALSSIAQIKRQVRDPDNGNHHRQPVGKPKRMEQKFEFNMLAYMLKNAANKLGWHIIGAVDMEELPVQRY